MDFKLNRWIQVTGSAAWSGRSNHRVCIGNGYIYLTGGSASGTANSEVWRSSDGETWSLLTAAPGWAARSAHGCVFLGGKIYVFGGANESGVFFNDCWSSTDGIVWTEETSSAGWSDRHEFGYCVHDNKIYVSGGYYSIGGYPYYFYSDVWSSTDGSSWTLVSSDFGRNIRQHSMVSFLGDLWIYGGNDNNVGPNSDIRHSTDDGANWTYEGNLPMLRFSMKAIVNDDGTQLVLLGGRTSISTYADVHLTTNGINFTSITQLTPHPNRYYFDAEYFNHNMFIIGGQTSGTDYNDVWKEQYIVTYMNNGGDGAPTDSTLYNPTDTVTVLSGGSMHWFGHTYTGWNTASDGSGTHYEGGDTFTYPFPEDNLRLYAEWSVIPLNFYIETVGSATFPFDTRAKAAHSLYELFDTLQAEDIWDLEPEWTIYAFGEIYEPDEWGWYEGNGAKLIGEDPQTTKFDMNTGTLETMDLYNCTFTTTNVDAEWNTCVYDPIEVKNCKFDGNNLWAEGVDVYRTGLDARIIGNSFENFIYAPLWLRDNGLTSANEIIVVNNSFDNPASVVELYMYYYNCTVGKIHFYNNLMRRVITELYLSSITILDFLHDHNNSTEGYDYTEDSAPFSPDATETTEDPLYLYLDPNNNLAIDIDSPAYHSGVSRIDVPITDLLGVPFGDPPSRGAYEATVPLIVDFSADPTTTIVQTPIQFTDESSEVADTYEWDFGDGSPVSTERNPVHSYEHVGYYTVTLTATLEGSPVVKTKPDYITINMLAAFVASPLLGHAPLTVGFIDQSLGEPTSWNWNFGDGSSNSTEQNPTHIYTEVGSYTVTLSVFNSTFSDTEIKVEYIITVARVEPEIPSAADYGGGFTRLHGPSLIFD